MVERRCVGGAGSLSRVLVSSPGWLTCAGSRTISTALYLSFLFFFFSRMDRTEEKKKILKSDSFKISRASRASMLE